MRPVTGYGTNVLLFSSTRRVRPRSGAARRGSLYDAFKEPLYAPPPLPLRMVEAGLLGRRSGRGFHTYGPVG